MGSVQLIKNNVEFYSLILNESVLVVACIAIGDETCESLDRVIDQLAETYGDRATVSKLDFDTNRSLATRFGVSQVPSVMFFKQGELVKTIVGYQPYRTFSILVEQYLVAIDRV